MRRKLNIVLGATALAGLGALVVPAGTVGTVMQGDVPDPLLPGGSFEVFNVEGSPCDGLVTGDAGELVDGWSAEPDVDGMWSATVQVPADAEPGTYTVTAHCEFAERTGLAAPAQTGGFDYQSFDVIVSAQPAPTTTTTEPPATAPTAVPAQPTFTG